MYVIGVSTTFPPHTIKISYWIQRSRVRPNSCTAPIKSWRHTNDPAFNYLLRLVPTLFNDDLLLLSNRCSPRYVEAALNCDFSRMTPWRAMLGAVGRLPSRIWIMYKSGTATIADLDTRKDVDLILFVIHLRASFFTAQLSNDSHLEQSLTPHRLQLSEESCFAAQDVHQ
jgi:hypothetical protein